MKIDFFNDQNLEVSDSERSRDISITYGLFSRPKLNELLTLLKLNINFYKGIGNYLYFKDQDLTEHKILDLLGGYGSLILGHNHKQIKDAAIWALQNDVVTHAQISVRSQSALLAEKLSELAGGDYITTFANSGTEAVEASLKHALLAWGKKKQEKLYKLDMAIAKFKNSAMGSSKTDINWIKNQVIIKKLELKRIEIRNTNPTVVCMKGSFHGKTSAALSVTGNPKYSGMYPGKTFDVSFLELDSTDVQIKSLFEKNNNRLYENENFSSIAAVILELIQGEGGVKPLPVELVKNLREETLINEVPLIIDEVQTGLFRTGYFIASHKYGIKPDYLLLGKSLGGGIAKISAAMIKRELYQDEFGIIHSSTFAEDDYSSIVALETLKILSADTTLGERIEGIGSYLKEKLLTIKEKYPKAIREIRGTGLIFGIEIETKGVENNPALVEIMTDTGLFSYLCASYLLHRHGIRVAPTLNSGQTLRLEPSSLITYEEAAKAISAFEELARCLHDADYAELMKHLWSGEVSNKEATGVVIPSVTVRKDIPRVCFMSHFIDGDHTISLEPIMEMVPEFEREPLINMLGEMSKTYRTSEQVIRGANGKEVILCMRGIPLTAKHMIESYRSGSLLALQKLKEGIEEEYNLGTRYIGLGQFTSIVGFNGLALENKNKLVYTTGNALTIAYAIDAVEDSITYNNLDKKNLVVGIVGALGNIGSVLSTWALKNAKEVVLVHRESPEKNFKFRETLIDLKKAHPTKKISGTDLISDLGSCDVVLFSTNAAQTINDLSVFKYGAVVLDLSVPSNVPSNIGILRPDLTTMKGGLASLPYNQTLVDKLIPLPPGKTFACMAETLTLALNGYPKHFSYGPLSYEKIDEIRLLARKAGFSLSEHLPIGGPGAVTRH